MGNFNREKSKTHSSKILFWLISVLLFHFIALGSGESGTTSLTRPRTKMNCLHDSSKTFWIRSSCQDGFVVVDKNRVLAQNTPRDSNDENVGIIKEECRKADFSQREQESLNSTDPLLAPSLIMSSPVKIRLFSPSANKYICFSPNGRIRAVISKRVKKRGNLCVFHERPVSEDPWSNVPQAFQLVNYQSAHNSSWYLGFKRTPTAKSRRRGGKRIHLPVQMTSSVLALIDQCEFQFSTGMYAPVPLEVEWKGLFERAREAFQTSSHSSIIKLGNNKTGDVTLVKPTTTLGIVESNLLENDPSSLPSLAEPKKRRKRRKKLRNRTITPEPPHQDSQSL